VTVTLAGQNFALILALVSLLWLVSIARRDVSIVDPWWSIAFLLPTAHSCLATGLGASKLALLALVALWAVRLWLHLLVRSRGKGEDPRYAAFRVRYGAERYWWFSFFQVFLLQGALAFVISAPLQLSASAPAADGISPIDWLGFALFAVGFGFEAIGDAQLLAFQRDSKKRGQVLDTGLWRYTRHPNYFGECLIGWGFWLCALDQPFGWATVFAPLLMTFLLLKVSGVAMLDAHLTSSKPGYREYIERTSAFFPRAPRQGSISTSGSSGSSR
jgi:steroid 5-alpha reductase family enzyme